MVTVTPISYSGATPIVLDSEAWHTRLVTADLTRSNVDGVRPLTRISDRVHLHVVGVKDVCSYAEDLQLCKRGDGHALSSIEVNGDIPSTIWLLDGVCDRDRSLREPGYFVMPTKILGRTSIECIYG